MFPQASMLTKIIISSLLCCDNTIYKEWLKSINYLKGEHAQKILVKIAVVTLNKRLCGDLEQQVEVIKIELSLFCLQKCIYASLVEIHRLAQKIYLRKG